MYAAESHSANMRQRQRFDAVRKLSRTGNPYLRVASEMSPKTHAKSRKAPAQKRSGGTRLTQNLTQ